MLMNRSLYTKLVAIIIILIICLMTVTGVFLVRGVRNYFLSEFYTQMQSVFSDRELADTLRSAADTDSAKALLTDTVKAYAGGLGINSDTRNFYILSGETGEYLSGSDVPASGIKITPNIVKAINGEDGYDSDPTAAYMDVALPVSGEGGSFIIYVLDNKADTDSLNEQIFHIIAEAVVIGLVISVLLSLLLAKTMIAPIQDLTKAAERVAAGDFSDKLENSSGDEIGVLTRTFNDMADRLETTLDDMTKSEKMRRDFVANVSHELRTPITSIRSYAETLSGDRSMPETTKQKFLEVILNESDRMAKIVKDLLTLSRFDAGSIEFTFENFSFERSVRDVYNAMLMEAGKHRHDFSLDFRGKIPEIRGDRARVEQVLMNMVSNAVKYTGNGGRIKMVAGTKDGCVWCSVSDNGAGIPKDDVGKVFDRFYRVDKARSRESGGTGLGLSIAKEIVTRHGGDIRLDSKVGKGTTVVVTLPVEGPS